MRRETEEVRGKRQEARGKAGEYLRASLTFERAIAFCAFELAVAFCTPFCAFELAIASCTPFVPFVPFVAIAFELAVASCTPLVAKIPSQVVFGDGDRGNAMANVVPLPGVFSRIWIFPLWYSSTMRFTNDSPSPQPRFFVLTPGRKI